MRPWVEVFLLPAQLPETGYLIPENLCLPTVNGNQGAENGFLDEMRSCVKALWLGEEDLQPWICGSLRVLESRWAMWLRVLGLAVWVDGAWGRDREVVRGAAGKQAKRMQAQAGRSHLEPHVLPSGPDRACNQPEEECLHRGALWEVRGCSYQGVFS